MFKGPEVSSIGHILQRQAGMIPLSLSFSLFLSLSLSFSLFLSLSLSFSLFLSLSLSFSLFLSLSLDTRRVGHDASHDECVDLRSHAPRFDVLIVGGGIGCAFANVISLSESFWLLLLSMLLCCFCCMCTFQAVLQGWQLPSGQSRWRRPLDKNSVPGSRQSFVCCNGAAALACLKHDPVAPGLCGREGPKP